MSEKLTQAQIKSEIDRKIWAIVRTLHDGDRVELIPARDSIKVLKVSRNEVKTENNSPR